MSAADMPVQMLNKPRGGRRTRNTATLMLRLPPELKGKLERSSAATLRRITAETIHRLERSFENESFDEHGVIVARSAPAAK